MQCGCSRLAPHLVPCACHKKNLIVWDEKMAAQNPEGKNLAWSFFPWRFRSVTLNGLSKKETTFRLRSLSYSVFASCSNSTCSSKIALLNWITKNHVNYIYIWILKQWPGMVVIINLQEAPDWRLSLDSNVLGFFKFAVLLLNFCQGVLPLIDIFHYGFILGCQRWSSWGGFWYGRWWDKIAIISLPKI